MPGITGRISHFVANDVVLRESKGPDEMFEALQTLDCGLERRRFVTGTQDYMQSFTNNHGMPYKFIASGDSESFDGAPWPLAETRSRLSWAARLIADDEAMDAGFNELLTIGYFGGQNIKYHDDGEKGLGETVASLSLGYPADMSFRVKHKHWTGMSKSGVFIETRPLPGTPRFEDRLLAYGRMQQSTVGEPTKNSISAASRMEKLRTIAKTLKLQDNVKDRKPWLRLRLSHGDMVVMHGQQIQEYLEHQVDPTGVLRFGLTARTILPEHLKPEERPSYEVLPDDGHYDGSGIKDMV
ncbi:hypothetical protein K461DRAFT_277764 [Myriangium duriaei CBS 260.36]|uniref:Alpha-ketoglutarate-dependent dioxygenase AlkB-like domain-containing protein n=1 Tax=Myriangium duriaei CBS 260.36 TaxID=1168546 RepID=A0A9P4J004_9PEZI|nr:hypothetical protein K461DRAFT_277764 [Myriangium duriaei CBS 260.36]